MDMVMVVELINCLIFFAWLKKVVFGMSVDIVRNLVEGRWLVHPLHYNWGYKEQVFPKDTTIKLRYSLSEIRSTEKI